jgi:hypothetical protein
VRRSSEAQQHKAVLLQLAQAAAAVQGVDSSRLVLLLCLNSGTQPALQRRHQGLLGCEWCVSGTAGVSGTP